LASCVADVARTNGGDPLAPDGGPPAPPPPAVMCDPATTMASDDAPAPLYGGTLIGLADGRTAVASDPDTDRVWVVDVSAGKVTGFVQLQPHDQPGRLVADGTGRVHVALRRGGALATIDLAGSALTATRRDVCPAPRGVAWDSTTDLVHVACAGGELVSLPAAGGPATRTVQIDDDLRDVVVVGSTLMVSRFRSAELLVVDAGGAVSARTRPQDMKAANDLRTFTPSVAWRLVPAPGGRVAMIHQRGTNATIQLATTGGPVGPGPVDMAVPSSGGYGGGGSSCNGDGPIVQSAISLFNPNGTTTPNPYTATPAAPLDGVTLPLDAALTADGNNWVFLSAEAVGSGRSTARFLSQIALDMPSTDGCSATLVQSLELPGNAVSIALVGSTLFVQTRFPTSLQPLTNQASLLHPGIILDDRAVDPGLDLFHGRSQAGLACASCHPEGGDDGRVWSFNTGKRRTMSLRGGLAGTEPFHWDGDEATMDALMADVFVQRMHDTLPGCDQLQSLANWVESIPTIPTQLADPAAVARGKLVFESQDADCSSCHYGPHFTSNNSNDVGTDGYFQVPRLTGLAASAPYFHDGRAATLRDRFDPTIGGGDMHGKTSQLTSSEIDDLVAYLSSL
jgi:mono/diheme cytochrome c family protein